MGTAGEANERGPNRPVTPSRASRPEHGIPPIRVYLDVPGGVVMQLLPVRGCDVWEPREDDPSKFRRVRVFHAFGPTDGLVPPLGTTLRVEPKSDDVRIVVCKYEDPNGRVRFTPTYPLRHTNN